MNMIQLFMDLQGCVSSTYEKSKVLRDMNWKTIHLTSTTWHFGNRYLRPRLNSRIPRFSTRSRVRSVRIDHFEPECDCATISGRKTPSSQGCGYDERRFARNRSRLGEGWGFRVRIILINKAKLILILLCSAYCASSDELWVSIILDMHVSVFW